jgi:hypothetical protein
MLETTDYSTAQGHIQSERAIFENLCKDSQSKKSGEAGFAFLDYFQKTWLPLALWESWSRKGRNDAATMLGTTIEGVLPTTNHLELFNGILKRKYIPQWQHAGCRLRFDVLIYRLIVNILPSIYAHHQMINSFQSWKLERFQDAAAGLPLATQASPKKPKFEPITWYSENVKRDAMAQDLVKLGRVILIESYKMYELWATCASTCADVTDSEHSRYWLTMHPSGSATCTCMDWLTQGGACKHLRAFHLVVLSWMQAKMLHYPYHFPSTKDEAVHIREQNRH